MFVCKVYDRDVGQSDKRIVAMKLVKHLIDRNYLSVNGVKAITIGHVVYLEYYGPYSPNASK